MNPSGEDEPRNEMYAQWLAEERQRRLDLFYAKRPAAFADKGQLDSRIHAWLEALVAADARALLLAGPTGTGKTWSTWKAIETLIFNGWRGGWATVTGYDLSRLVAPPVDDDRLTELAEVDLLAIDDLGSAPLTDWSGSHLGGLVDRRWSHQRATVITTNIQNIGDLIGPRAASRLADGMTAIVLDGADRRRTR